MEGYGIAIIISVVLFFLISVLAIYCLCKILQLMKIGFLRNRATRWSLALVVSLPVSLIMEKIFVFADRIHFITLLALILISFLLKIVESSLDNKPDHE